jgi:hypothetical protein
MPRFVHSLSLLLLLLPAQAQPPEALAAALRYLNCQAELHYALLPEAEALSRSLAAGEKAAFSPPEAAAQACSLPEALRSAPGFGQLERLLAQRSALCRQLGAASAPDEQFRLLRALAVWLEDYATLSARLDFELEKAWQAQLPAGLSDPVLRGSRELAALLERGAACQLALRGGDSLQSVQAISRFRQALASAHSRQASALRNAADPRVGKAYERCLAHAEQFEALLRRWEAGEAAPPAWRSFGRAYFFSSQLLGNKLYRPGESLAEAYDQFAALGSLPLLPAARRSPFFRPLELPPAPEAFHWMILADFSGSMSQPGKWQQLPAALANWWAEQGPESQCSLLLFSDSAWLQAGGLRGPEAFGAMEALSRLRPRGGSQPADAFALACEQLRRIPGGPRPALLLLTDGGFAIDERLASPLTEAGYVLHVRYLGREEAARRPALSALAAQTGGSYAPWTQPPGPAPWQSARP